jgi:hypothetical protein
LKCGFILHLRHIGALPTLASHLGILMVSKGVRGAGTRRMDGMDGWGGWMGRMEGQHCALEPGNLLCPVVHGVQLHSQVFCTLFSAVQCSAVQYNENIYYSSFTALLVTVKISPCQGSRVVWRRFLITIRPLETQFSYRS